MCCGHGTRQPGFIACRAKARGEEISDVLFGCSRSDHRKETYHIVSLDDISALGVAANVYYKARGSRSQVESGEGREANLEVLRSIDQWRQHALDAIARLLDLDLDSHLNDQGFAGECTGGG